MAKLSKITFALFLSALVALAEGQSCASLPRYVYRADKRTFEDAKRVCSEMGAHLAVANTNEEALLLSNLVQHSQDTFEYAFVGFSFDGTSWRTVDGALLSDSGHDTWMAGEPSFSTFSSGGSTYREGCGAIGWNGMYNDLVCQFQHPYICEFFTKLCTK